MGGNVAHLDPGREARQRMKPALFPPVGRTVSRVPFGEVRMDQSMIAFIKGAIAFLMVSGTAMTGVWLWFRLRATYRTDAQPVIDALRDEHARLEAEMGSRMAELEDRVDFVERRLVQGKPPTNLPPRPERTPV